MDKHSARDATPTGRVGAPRKCHIVIDDDDLSRDTLETREFSGEPEIKSVAGIVLDDEQYARWPSHSADSGEHGVGARGGEDISGHSRVQQPWPNITRVGGLMPGAAARDKRHALRRTAGADDNRLPLQEREVGVEAHQTL
jgi:hypothetical protein